MTSGAVVNLQRDDSAESVNLVARSEVRQRESGDDQVVGLSQA